MTHKTDLPQPIEGTTPSPQVFIPEADSLVARIRQRLLPLIEKEIDKLNPNP